MQYKTRVHEAGGVGNGQKMTKRDFFVVCLEKSYPKG